MGVGQGETPPSGDGSRTGQHAYGHSRTEVIKFGVFELRTDIRELLKQGIRIKLQIKPFQVLETLVERPGELVTREELRNRLWPSGTFVDFESGLNTAINRLRVALGDSAEVPRYIETLPRLGYRFISTVERVTNQKPPVASHSSPALLSPSAIVASAPANVAKVQTEPVLPSLPTPPKPDRRIIWIAAAGVACLLGIGLFQFTPLHHSSADFRLVNLRGGALVSARFLSGSRVIYSARLNDTRQTFVSNLDGRNSYTVPVTGVVAAASAEGDLALLSSDASDPSHQMLLTRSSIKGGSSAATIADNVFVADWSPDAKQLAIVRELGSESVLEFPVGQVVYRSQGWISCLRVSRDGRDLALLEHPARDDDRGFVRIVSANRTTRILTPEWGSADGLAWSPSGREIWFTASKAGLNRNLYSVSLKGTVRKLSNQPSSLRLFDVASNGRALLAIDDARMVLKTSVSGKESEISEFDFSHVDDMTQDGKVLLFTESGDAGGLHYAAYVYDRISSKARRFGSGRALSLSHDGKQALTVDPQDRTALTITSLASGRATRVPGSGFHYQWAKFSHTGDLLVGGSFAGQPLLIAHQNISTGTVLPIVDAPYLDSVAISPDGTTIAGRLADKTEIFDLSTKAIQPLPAALQDTPVAWSADGKSLFLLTSSHSVYSILEFFIPTGTITSWKTISPQNAATFVGMAGVAAAPNSDAYAYSAHLNLSHLYVVDGLT